MVTTALRAWAQLLWWSSFSCLALASNIASAQVLHVNPTLANTNPPGSANGSESFPFATIKAALVRALAGDHIIVYPGKYPENVHLSPGIRLEAKFHAADAPRVEDISQLQIDQANAPTKPGVILAGDDPRTALVGFNVVGGQAPLGAGVLVTASRATVEGNVFFRNIAEGPNARGAGVAIVAGDSEIDHLIEIIGNRFVGNEARSDETGLSGGGGLACIGGGQRTEVKLQDNHFDGGIFANRADHGGATLVSACELHSVGNRFEANVAARSGGALFCDADSSGRGSRLRLERDVFTANTALAGGAVAISGDCRPPGVGAGEEGTLIQGVTFTANSAKQRGGALLLLGHSVASQASIQTIVDSQFADNIAREGAAIMAVGPNLGVNLWRSTVEANRSERTGAIFATLLDRASRFGPDLHIENNRCVTPLACSAAGLRLSEIDFPSDDYAGGLRIMGTQFVANASQGGTALELSDCQQTTLGDDGSPLSPDPNLFFDNMGGDAAILIERGSNVKIRGNQIGDAMRGNAGRGLRIHDEGTEVILMSGSSQLRVEGNTEGGIEVRDAAQADFLDLFIGYNHGSEFGGGVSCIDARCTFDVQQTGRIIVANNTALQAGGGIHFDHPRALTRLRGVELRDNQVATQSTKLGRGGGLHLDGMIDGASDLSVSNNVADLGGGIALESGALLRISASEITGNQARHEGGGIWTAPMSQLELGTTADMQNLATSFMANNQADVAGGGLYLGGDGRVLGLHLGARADISGNRAPLGGGIFAEQDSSLFGHILCIRGNTADEGGGIYDQSSRMQLHNTSFMANQAATAATARFEAGAEIEASAFINFSPGDLKCGTPLTGRHNHWSLPADAHLPDCARNPEFVEATQDERLEWAAAAPSLPGCRNAEVTSIGDFGDAPDGRAGALPSGYDDAQEPQFPSTHAASGPHHRHPKLVWLAAELGRPPSLEIDASLDPSTSLIDGDRHDDGLITDHFPACQAVALQLGLAATPILAAFPELKFYVNILADWDGDAAWGGTAQQCQGTLPEWILVNHPVEFEAGSSSLFLLPEIQLGEAGLTWLRVLVSASKIIEPEWRGQGPEQGFTWGEVEDHLVCLTAIGENGQTAFDCGADVGESGHGEQGQGQEELSGSAGHEGSHGTTDGPTSSAGFPTESNDACDCRGSGYNWRKAAWALFL